MFYNSTVFVKKIVDTIDSNVELCAEFCLHIARLCETGSDLKLHTQIQSRFTFFQRHTL